MSAEAKPEEKEEAVSVNDVQGYLTRRSMQPFSTADIAQGLGLPGKVNEIERILHDLSCKDVLSNQGRITATTTEDEQREWTFHPDENALQAWREIRDRLKPTSKRGGFAIFCYDLTGDASYQGGKELGPFSGQQPKNVRILVADDRDKLSQKFYALNKSILEYRASEVKQFNWAIASAIQRGAESSGFALGKKTTRCIIALDLSKYCLPSTILGAPLFVNRDSQEEQPNVPQVSPSILARIQELLNYLGIPRSGFPPNPVRR